MVHSRLVAAASRTPLGAGALPASLLSCAVALTVACVAAAPAGATVTLAAPVAKATLDQPEGVVLADVDRDGFDDAIVGNRDGQAIQVFRGGPEGLRAPVSHQTGHNLPVAVAAGDLNGDGKADLVSSASVGGQNGKVAVLLGDGAGGFAAAPGSPYATGADGPLTGSGVAVADITGDGRLDVITGGDNDLVVMPGDGTGALLAPVVRTLGFSVLRSIAVGDFVGDGRPDVITGSGLPQQLSELFENVGGSLSFHSLRADTGNEVAAGDLDGSGRDDLAFTRLAGSDVGALLSTGDGAFGAEPQITGAGMFFVSGLALADVDADGRADLAVGGQDHVELFAGTGPSGAFASVPGSPIGAAGLNPGVALGDVTGDGQPDLVHTMRDADRVTLVENLNDASASGPASVGFGSSAAGGPAVERTVTLTSGGPGFYRAAATAIAPGGSGLAIAGDTCSGRSLAVGASCAVTLRFTPGAAAGAVAATLTVSDNTAAGTRSIPLTATVTTPGGGPRDPGSGRDPTGTDRTRPVVSALRLSPASFAVAKRKTSPRAAARKRPARRGTTIRFTLSEGARVRFAFERRASGLRSGRRCVAPTRSLRRAKARSCVRFVAAGALARSGRRGANAVAFSGRIGAKALRTGRHRVTVSAIDAAGNRGATVRAAFRVVADR